MNITTARYSGTEMMKGVFEMKQYIGTKLVEAEPAVRNEQDGYKVRYADGYESWSPKDVFEEAYRLIDGMNFGLAIEAVRKGHKARRRGWNGKNQYIKLASAIIYKSMDGSMVHAKHDDIGSQAIAFCGTSGVQIGWLASQADMLADDWELVQ